MVIALFLALQAPALPPMPAPGERPAAATLVVEPVGMFLAACDADGDARTTRAEADAGVAHSFADIAKGAAAIGYIAYADWAERWLGDRTALPGPFEVDRDGDNRITAGELQARVGAIFQRIDRDRDGVLTRAELLTIRSMPGDGRAGTGDAETMGAHHDHSHGHSHGHGHGHGHGHAHAPADFGRAFLIGTLLNLGFVAIEATAGFWTNSVALLADAGHNLSDVLGLLIAWGGAELAKRPASKRFTYGLGASTILAALANALVLLVAVGAILWEAVRRLGDPTPVPGWPVVWVALAGIAVNLGTALLFARGRHGNVNVRGAYLHMAADAAVSAGVVIAGLVILWTGAAWIDPLVSLIVVAVILIGTWGLLSESLLLALQAVPPGVDPDAVARMLAALPGVVRVHDLHIWSMSTTRTALTAHLVMPAGHPGDEFLADTAHRLEHDFAIGHATLQIERAEDCALAHAH